jgi:hypothetical protein
VLDVRGGTGAWRVGDVLTDRGKTLMQLADLILQVEAAGALSITR